MSKAVFHVNLLNNDESCKMFTIEIVPSMFKLLRSFVLIMYAKVTMSHSLSYTLA